MKRQHLRNRDFMEFGDLSANNYEDVQLEDRTRPRTAEHTLVAQLQDGDSLQSISLRFNCTVGELKRLNKIEKDVEIFARKTIKVPITAHSVLLETLPSVHTSGQSSPKHIEATSITQTNASLNQDTLDEKLMVAAVTQANSVSSSDARTINDIILNTTIISNRYADENDTETMANTINNSESFSQPLLSGEFDERQPHPVPVRNRTEFSCNGSDCDISWICLLVCILALCFAIPLIYVFYVAEHLEKYHHHD